MRMSLRRTVGMALTASVALAMTACNSGTDTKPDSAKGKQTTSSAPGAVAWLKKGAVCPALQRIDASRYLGDKAKIQVACGTSKQDTNELGMQVWSDGSKGADIKHITVLVVNNTDAGGLVMSYAQTRDQQYTTAKQKDCSITAAGAKRKCLNFMAESGMLVIDMGEQTTLTVYPSTSNGTTPDNTPLDSKAEQDKLRKFASYAAGVIYKS